MWMEILFGMLGFSDWCSIDISGWVLDKSGKVPIIDGSDSGSREGFVSSHEGEIEYA